MAYTLSCQLAANKDSIFGGAVPDILQAAMHKANAQKPSHPFAPKLTSSRCYYQSWCPSIEGLASTF